MTLAFATGAALPTRKSSSPSTITPRMATKDASAVIDKYFPTYQRYRAPLIKIDGQQAISVSMPPVQAFTETEKSTQPLFNYQDEDLFTPNKPVPPSPISWPAGDGRGNECTGTKGFYNQADLKTYGPFPDFFKRSCDG